jgi:hypothetical protein
MDLGKWLDFKIRNNYLDLPNENYKPAPIARLLLIINKMYFMFSLFGIIWWIFLYSSVFLDPIFITTISFIVFSCIVGLFWMVITKQLPLESFLIVLIFLIGSSMIWLVKFRA